MSIKSSTILSSAFLLVFVSLSGCISIQRGLPVTGSLPVIQIFEAAPAVIKAGEYSTLSWEVTDASGVNIDNHIGNVALKGNMSVAPGGTTYYVLTASNSTGVTTATAQIMVSRSASDTTANPSGVYQAGGQRTLVLSAIPAESGALVKNVNMYTLQDTACAGDTPANLASRAFLSFNIGDIPANAIINEAALDLTGYEQMGNPTYKLSGFGNMGALEVYFYQYGGLSDLGTMAYNRPAELVSEGEITSYPLSPWQVDVKTADDGEQVMQSLVQSGQTRCQFRIQFFTSTNWDGKADMLCFDNAKLIIKYTVP